MVADDSTSTLNLILQAQLQTNMLLERIAGALEQQGQPTKRNRTQVTEALASEVVYLMTRPENRKKNGSVNKSAVAKAAGINIKTLTNMPEAQQAIDVIEGRYGR